MNKIVKKKSGWRWPRRILITLAVLVTLVALLYAEEDWRGKRALENYKHEWEAKGEKFDWQEFVPPSVPDDQNFFTAPILTNMLNGKIAMSPYRIDGSSPDKPGGYWAKMSMTDLKAWQTYYRNPTNANSTKEFPIAPQPQTPAADVLLALGKYDSAIEELSQASQRPYSRVPLNYEDGFNALSPLLEDMAALKRCSQLFQLRAVAELSGGQSAKALDDVKLLFRLNDSIRSTPFLISELVRMAITSIMLQPVWEGLAEHKWSDEQLVALDVELAKLDFLADFEFAMRGERVFAIADIENQRRTRKMIFLEDNGDIANTNKPVVESLRFMPSAFFYQTEFAFAWMDQQYILTLIDTNARVIAPENLRRTDSAVREEMKHYSPYKAQAIMVVPALDAGVKKFAFAQASVDLARIACALERYRLAHGEYPETLDALEPQFIEKLPHDIINGQPLHYRRTDDGKFVLYSVGWDEKDDGGKIIFTKSGSVDREKGDWVWQYPQN
jgi:tetratricopeptide (TPR) repeat protein